MKSLFITFYSRTVARWTVNSFFFAIFMHSASRKGARFLCCIEMQIQTLLWKFLHNRSLTRSNQRNLFIQVRENESMKNRKNPKTDKFLLQLKFYFEIFCCLQKALNIVQNNLFEVKHFKLHLKVDMLWFDSCTFWAELLLGNLSLWHICYCKDRSTNSQRIRTS